MLNCRRYRVFLRKKISKEKGSFFGITVFKVLEKDFNVNHLSEYVIHGHDEINLLGGGRTKQRHLIFSLGLCKRFFYNLFIWTSK